MDAACRLRMEQRGFTDTWRVQGWRGAQAWLPNGYLVPGFALLLLVLQDEVCDAIP